MTMKRNAMCGQVSTEQAGQSITLSGWVQRVRDRGSILFVLLRDRTGIVQVTFDQQKCPPEVFEIAKACRGETVLTVQGQVALRDAEAVNASMPTGQVEVFAERAEIVNQAATPPIYIDDDHPDENEAVRLKYRYLDLRRPSMQANLRLRHTVTAAIRESMDSQDFLEMETPILSKSTPEGARDFLVPSRVHQGEFYALPQAPQIYKQLLMLAGFDRYYQIARCFRDEDNRADRQPEFTQMDMEMSFAEEVDVQSVIEGVFQNVFRKAIGQELKLPLPRMTWQQAMDTYGVDKPDRRFGLELIDVGDVVGDAGFSVFDNALSSGGTVRGINAKGCAGRLSRKDIDALGEYVKTYRAKGLAWIVVEEAGPRSPIAKFFSQEAMQALLARMGAEPGDALFFVADRRPVVWQALGNLRLEIGRKLDLIDTARHDLFWVVDFPLFEYDEETKAYVSMHNPFTSMMPEDEALVDAGEYENVRARAYDLVLDGLEMGSGAIRIHRADAQARMFKLLGLPDEEVKERFGFLLDAYRYGAPSHGGFAFGVDRLMMALLRTQSLRDVLAFPKAQNGACLMMETPTPVPQEQLDVLGLRVEAGKAGE